MKYIWSAERNEFVPKERVTDGAHFVQGDIPEFRSTDGAVISGRRQWRDHLKESGCIEMGLSDMMAQKDRWDSRKSSFQSKIAGAAQQQVREVAPPSGEIREIDRTRQTAEVLNRLEGRPAPDRKTLIKLNIEVARELARRR